MSSSQADGGYDTAQVQAIRDVAARIERLPFSSWHVKARVLIGTATLFDAFDALTIAQVLPVLRPLWNLSGPKGSANNMASNRPVGVNLSYTINLNLPATSDQAVFNAIFKSLREHLLSHEEE
jgi:hypothetical protein